MPVSKANMRELKKQARVNPKLSDSVNPTEVLRNVPYSPYDVMAEIEDIQRVFPDKITLEDRIERAYNYFVFWTTLRQEKVRDYREAQEI